MTDISQKELRLNFMAIASAFRLLSELTVAVNLYLEYIKNVFISVSLQILTVFSNVMFVVVYHPHDFFAVCYGIQNVNDRKNLKKSSKNHHQLKVVTKKKRNLTVFIFLSFLGYLEMRHITDRYLLLLYMCIIRTYDSLG